LPVVLKQEIILALKEYRRKRHFSKTGEPAARMQHSKSGRLYCIQRHDASRLHYDLRLELNGLLNNWAVPKGPSLNPADKRLAVLMEEHPVEYGSFEGLIPESEYGVVR
jgi:bifunctional non-homologous end joining protein LigD